MKALVILLFLISVGSFALFSKSCCQHEQQMVRDLQADAHIVLKARKDFSDVTADVQHLDVILSGVVPAGMSASVVEQVQQALRAGRVISRLEEASPAKEIDIASAAQPSEVFFQRQGDQMILRGRVATQSIKDVIEDSASTLPKVRRVINGIEISDSVPSFDDPDGLAHFSRTFMKQTEEGLVQWTDNQLVLRGKVQSHAVKTMIEFEATPLAQHLSLVNELQVIEKTSTASANLHCLVKTTNHGTREGVLRGTLPSEELCQATIQAAIEATPELKWTSELQASPVSQAPSWTTNAPGFVTTFLNEARDQDRGFLLRSGSIHVLNIPESDQGTRIGIAAQELLGSEVQLIFDGDAAPIESTVAQTVPETQAPGETVTADSPLADLRAPEPPALPYSPASTPNVPLRTLAKQLKALPIYFDTNQEAPNAAQGKKIQQVAELLRAVPPDNRPPLVVAGFAEHGSNADDNNALSLRRATHVKAKLVRLGMDASTISVRSIGSDHGTTSVGTKDDSAVNSEPRVEFQLGQPSTNL